MDEAGQLINPIIGVERLALLTLVVVVVGVVLAWRSSAAAPRGVRLVCAAARTLALLLLAIAAFNPGRWVRPSDGTPPEWAVIVDRSGSMGVRDVEGHSRWEEATRRAGGLLEAVPNPDQLRLATLAENVEDCDLLTGVTPAGDTDIVGGLVSFMRSFGAGGPRLAGVVLFSDGRQVRESNADRLVLELRSRAIPLHVYPLGGPVPRRDLAITPVQRRHIAFAGQTLRIRAGITATGLDPVSPRVTLLDEGGAVLAETRVDLGTTGRVDLALEFTPKQPGVVTCRLAVEVQNDEADVENNQAAVSVNVLDSRLRVLMAEGIPFWDTKFLTQLLRKQANMEVTSIYRVSSERFFMVETDLGQVSDSTRSSFPETPAELKAYDLVVLGKGMEYILTPERIRLLRDYVRHDGGCVIFSRGRPYGGVFPELEPLEPAEWEEPLNVEFRLRPTVAGVDAGLFGDVLPPATDPAWKKLPPLRGAHRLRERGFAQTLAEAVPETPGVAPFKALVSQRYGKGVVLLLNSEGLWQWSFFPSDPMVGQMYADFWIQLLTWAGTYAEFLPGQSHSLRLSDASVAPGTQVRARIHRRVEATNDAVPLLSLWLGSNRLQEVAATPTPGDARQWEAVFAVNEPGLVRVDLGDSTLAAPAVLHVRHPARETDEPGADPGFLQQLAAASGGRVLEATGLRDLAETMTVGETAESRGQPIWASAWDRAWLLLLLIACVGIEWTLRRRNGLL